MKRRLLYSTSILALVSAWRADATLAAAKARSKPGDRYFGSVVR